MWGSTSPLLPLCPAALPAGGLNASPTWKPRHDTPPLTLKNIFAMMRYNTLFSIAILWLCVNVGLAQSRELVILHTNDTHSQIDPYTKAKYNEFNVGGFLRREAAIREVRSRHADVLLIDAGDFSQGTPYFNVYKGYVEVKLMNAMHYDAVALGNHEFDNGCAALARRLRKAKFPVLCANYRFDNRALSKQVRPYAIVEKGGLKIGVFGLLVNLRGLTSPDILEEAHYLDPVETSMRMVAELRERGCDMVVCLSHLGVDGEQTTDFDIAEQVAGIDFIVGGHSHVCFMEPKVVNRVPVMQVGHRGKLVGQLTVNY